MRIVEGFEKAKKELSKREPMWYLTSLVESTPKKTKQSDRRKLQDEVLNIIGDVRKRGDKAVIKYTSKFDKVKLTSLEVDKGQITSAYQEIDAELVSALRLAAERIHSFHTAQKDAIYAIWRGAAKPGLAQLIRPLNRLGIYVPGGTASYPSTVLMTAIPARVAGVNEIILVTPPRLNGVVAPAILAAADIAQVDRIFAVGGAQAIAALAFGTESIPRVDKICGPGNIFVTLAKKLVYGEVGIDGLQGPSEVVIIADETANPEYCAADLLAQAEHDPLASAILLTTSRQLADRVNQEIEQQLKDLPRQTIAVGSLENSGIIAVVASVDEAIELANLYAPEHLCLMVDKAASYIDRVSSAGCVVAGKKSTVVLSDYVAGPSHVLPTGGTARFSSPLNVSDFIKLTNVITVDDASLKKLGQAAQAIARAEGFEAHARAVEKRLKKGIRNKATKKRG